MNPFYGIISWLIIGALAGWLASKIMGTDARQGWLGNISIGIVGAVVGGCLARVFLGDSSSSNGLLVSFFVTLAGACLVIFAWVRLSRRTA